MFRQKNLDHLYVIIEDKVCSAVFLQQFKCIMVGKIFKLYQDFLAIVLFNCGHKFLYKFSVFFPSSPILLQSNVKLVIQKLLVVCANIKGYRQALQTKRIRISWLNQGERDRISNYLDFIANSTIQYNVFDS